LSNNIFYLTFSDSDRGSHRLKFEPDDPDGCGFYHERQGEVEVLGECLPWCRETIRSGDHTLTLRGEDRSVSALVDGALCISAAMGHRPDELTVGLSTVALSCVAFDDIHVRLDELGAGWTPHLEERFDASPLQNARLASRFDFYSLRSRIILTWALIAAALLFDLAALALFGRRFPEQVLLLTSVPQMLTMIGLQNAFLLPLAPLLCSVSAVWTAKAFLSFSGLPREVGRIYYPRRRILPALALIAVSVVLPLLPGPELRTALSGGTFASASIAAMLLILSGKWVLRDQKRRFVSWFFLCGIQALHWFWFRKIWVFAGLETMVLVSMISAILLISLYAGAIWKPAWMRVSGRLLVVALLVVCVEFTIRSVPAQSILDFDRRISCSFWDLEKHTNLIEKQTGEHAPEEPYGNIHGREKTEGAYRIICLGSSSTAGVGADNPETESYPAQLGLLLRSGSNDSIEVINAGVGGYGLTQLRVYFEQILANLEPDLLILYFGGNRDRPSDYSYYKRVEALLEANPTITHPNEVEAALSLRWPHPALIRSYLFLARTRLFVGLKLLIDSILPDGGEGAAPAPDREFYATSADLLVEAALRNGTAILLIPEIVIERKGHPYDSIFEELARSHAGEPVHMFRIEEFDVSTNMADPQHMNAKGYGEFAGIIADHLVGSGLIPCHPIKEEGKG